MGLFLLKSKENYKKFNTLVKDFGTSTFLYSGRALRKGWKDKAVILNSNYKKFVIVELRGDMTRGKVLKIKNLNEDENEKVMHFQSFGNKREFIVGVSDKGYIYFCCYDLDRLKLKFKHKRRIKPDFDVTKDEGATVGSSEDGRFIMVHSCTRNCNPKEVIIYEVQCHILILKRVLDVSQCAKQYFYAFEFFKVIEGLYFFAGLEAYSEPNKFCIFSYNKEEDEVKYWEELMLPLHVGRACRVENLNGALVSGSENLRILKFELEIE